MRSSVESKSAIDDARPAAPPFEERLERWLRDVAQVSEPRRVVRASSDRVVVSKVRPGFIDDLDAAVDGVPGLFDPPKHRAWYIEGVSAASSRPEAWRLGLEAGLRQYEAQGLVDGKQRAELMAGVDSVAAILETAIWTSPAAAVPWQPSAAEERAFRETLALLQPGAPIFTREYGRFEGRRVANHCPGARHAIRLLQLAWDACAQPADGAAGGRIT